MVIGTAGRATDNVSQRVLMVRDNDKGHRLEAELSSLDDRQRVIVFVNTKRHCDGVHAQLEALGYRRAAAACLPARLAAALLPLCCPLPRCCFARSLAR